MADRCTLHVKKLEDFKQWLVEDGWEIVEPRGDYEVLRAKKPGRMNPLMVYTKLESKEKPHLSLMDRDIGVVRAYLRDRKEKKK